MGEESTRSGVEGGAGGGDVIYEEEALAGDTLRLSDLEGAVDVGSAGSRVETCLALCLSAADEGATIQGEVEAAREGACQEHRLVVAAPGEAAAMEGDGDHAIEGEFCEGELGPEARQGAREVAATVVFQVVDRVGEGASIEERRLEVNERRRVATTPRTAPSAPRLAAARAGIFRRDQSHGARYTE